MVVASFFTVVALCIIYCIIRMQTTFELYLSSGMDVVLEHYITTDTDFSPCILRRRICSLYFLEGSVKANVG